VIFILKFYGIMGDVWYVVWSSFMMRSILPISIACVVVCYVVFDKFMDV
jgi:hypothetical protein